jgi:hypothetical protein
MADWRQIQARIRKARTSSDPPAQLAALYERTRDAMVAFELAQWHEKAGNASETVQWYTTAAQRFRRAQWRSKAEEALTRLGAPIPEAGQAAAAEHAETAGSATPHEVVGAAESSQAESALPYVTSMESEAAGLHESNGREPSEGLAEASAAPPGAGGAAGAGKRRRRGRRGGRKRRDRGGAGRQATAAGAQAGRPSGIPMEAQPSAPGYRGGAAGAERAFAAEAEKQVEERQAPQGPRIEPTSFEAERHGRPAPAAWQGVSGGLVSARSRAGEPGLSSRIAQLESQLRRLLACPLASLDEADSAPAGPGVLLLSDSDQVTHYYVEACQTLRIGIGNLLRGGRGSKGAAQLKPSLAEHLGINESRVAKYMKDHCTVRWIQLDEGAAELAHFAIAVLRPVVAQ